MEESIRLDREKVLQLCCASIENVGIGVLQRPDSIVLLSFM